MPPAGGEPSVGRAVRPGLVDSHVELLGAAPRPLRPPIEPSTGEARSQEHAAAWPVGGFSHRESRVTLEFEAAALPVLPGALELALQFQPAGLKSNRRQFEVHVHEQAAIDEALRALVFDPQTSGGLLIAVDRGHVAALIDDLEAEGVLAARVGHVEPRADVLILVEP